MHGGLLSPRNQVSSATGLLEHQMCVSFMFWLLTFLNLHSKKDERLILNSHLKANCSFNFEMYPPLTLQLV